MGAWLGLGARGWETQDQRGPPALDLGQDMAERGHQGFRKPRPGQSRGVGRLPAGPGQLGTERCVF